jgi:shikimate kinase
MNGPVVITGFMGAGKTTVALAVAEKLGWRAVDLDSFIEREEGRSPKEIINQDGEAAFRAIESAQLARALALGDRQVIALGGGAWIQKRNRGLIRNHHAFTVWLDAPFEVCWIRIAVTGSERPLAPNKEAAKALYEERRQYYSLARFHLMAAGADDVERLAVIIAEAATKRLDLPSGAEQV